MKLVILRLLAVVAPLLPHGICMLTPDDIPDKWKSSVSQAWDNALIRSERETPETGLVTYPNWALDQIMDGEGYVKEYVPLFNQDSSAYLSRSSGRSMFACAGVPTRP